MIATKEMQSMELDQLEPETCTRTIDASIDRAVRDRLAACPYHFVFDRITWHVDDGRLRLRGCVPSFYLKQVLQELLRDMEEVEGITNEVDVVSSSGLSSKRLNESC